MYSGRHCTARFRACPAHRDALVHAADPLAITGAFGANLRTFATGVLVMRRVDQHEMGRSPAYFGTGHHEPEMGGLDMFPAGFETMIHGGGETGSVAGETGLDAAVRVCG
jgi:hypothetical protein